MCCDLKTLTKKVWTYFYIFILYFVMCPNQNEKLIEDVLKQARHNNIDLIVKSHF